MCSSDLFSSRAAQFETLLGAAGRTELTVGVVGITSSGKSTLINAMMGKRLLPEETRATTNVTVLCRKGGIRAVDVGYEDGDSIMGYKCLMLMFAKRPSKEEFSIMYGWN